MTRAYFITGTDTEIGKTYVACALLHAFRRQGLTAFGMKPVAAGTDDAGLNDDVEALIAASSLALPRDRVNPYCFADPIAPHIAAAEAGVTIAADRIRQALDELTAQANVVVIEGVGGFVVPLAENFDAADLAKELAAGWIANRIDPEMSRFEKNLAALKARIDAPLLGVVPHALAGGAEAAASHLALAPLLDVR